MQDKVSDKDAAAREFTRVTLERTRCAGDGSERVLSHDLVTVERLDDGEAVLLAGQSLMRWTGLEIIRDSRNASREDDGYSHGPNGVVGAHADGPDSDSGT